MSKRLLFPVLALSVLCGCEFFTGLLGQTDPFVGRWISVSGVPVTYEFDKEGGWGRYVSSEDPVGYKATASGTYTHTDSFLSLQYESGPLLSVTYEFNDDKTLLSLASPLRIDLERTENSLAELYPAKEKLEAPAISVSGTQAPATVTITASAGATVHYTVNGSEPSGHSTAYTEPFPVFKRCTVKAFAQREGMLDSDVATAALAVTPVTLGIGQSYDFKGILLRVNHIFWVRSWGFPRRIVGIEVDITNNRTAPLTYCNAFTWGVLTDSNGMDLQSIAYLDATDVTYFYGASIPAGATVTDTQSFERFEGSPVSFTFRGAIPVDDACYFEIPFLREDVETR